MSITAPILLNSAETTPDVVNIPNLISQWLGEIEATAATRAIYAKGMQKFLEWLEDHPQPVSARTIRTWRDTIKATYAAATVNVWLSAVRSFFAWLFEQELIESSPAATVKGAKRNNTTKKHKRDELTSGEVRRVLASVEQDTAKGARAYAIITLMAYCGLRTVEVHRADISDLQTKNGRTVLWVQGKGAVEKDDFVVLPSPVEDAIARWLAVHPLARQQNMKARPLFSSFSPRSRGGRLSTSYIRRMVKNAYYAVGITSPRKTTHSLRHSAISSAIRNGADLLQVQSMARHADPKTTMIYYHEIGRTDNPAEDLVSY